MEDQVTPRPINFSVALKRYQKRSGMSTGLLAKCLKIDRLRLDAVLLGNESPPFSENFWKRVKNLPRMSEEQFDQLKEAVKLDLEAQRISRQETAIATGETSTFLMRLLEEGRTLDSLHVLSVGAKFLEETFDIPATELMRGLNSIR